MDGRHTIATTVHAHESMLWMEYDTYPNAPQHRSREGLKLLRLLPSINVRTLDYQSIGDISLLQNPPVLTEGEPRSHAIAHLPPLLDVANCPLQCGKKASDSSQKPSWMGLSAEKWF